MSLYVYCLGDELTEAALVGLAGVGGARVRLLSLTERLSAAVSDASGEPFAVTEENLTAHNRVNAAALAVSTPLPFRFGTSAAPERLKEFAASNEATLAATLARVRGCVEMSVKLMEKAKGGGQKAEGRRQKAEVEDGGREAAEVGRGTAFLLRKRREVLGEEEARARAEELAAWLAEGVGALARESAVRVSPPEAIVVRAAHLIARERVGEYRTRLRELGATRPGLRLLASGPWPPYSFSELSEQNRER